MIAYLREHRGWFDGDEARMPDEAQYGVDSPSLYGILW